MRTRHEQIDMKDVQLKHPTAQRGNGLLVILEGEHCGKYARRINHHEEGGSVVMEVAIVSHSVGQDDTRTGEILRLDPKLFGMVAEDSKTRKKNTACVSAIREDVREQARKEYRPKK